MRVLPTRPLVLLPLVTAVAMLLPRSAPAADPVAWRTDYNSARKESAEKGLPLFVVVGTDNCFYCKKLEAGPCRDAAVVAQLSTNFIPLKLDASREPNLARALKVQLYPTIVLAAPDGKIHAFVEGYIEADRLADHLKRAGSAIVTTEWAVRDLELANRAVADRDFQRAIPLLKGITKELSDKPLGSKAQLALDDIERQAASRLARAKDLEQKGLSLEAIDVLAETVKTYVGTQSALDAASLMTGLSNKPEMQDKLRIRTARDLLALAKDDFRAGRYYECLQKCEQLTLYSDLPEGKEGQSLAADVKGNPERLAAICEQMNQKTASMYMMLAESWASKGQAGEAIACYEKVMKLCPNTRSGDLALAQLTKLRASASMTTTNLTKPNQ